MVQPATTRPPHEQVITLDDAQTPIDIEWTQFIAFVDITSMKFDRYGNWCMTLQIPPEFIERGLLMRHFAGTILSVDVQKWKAVQSDEDDG